MSEQPEYVSPNRTATLNRGQRSVFKQPLAREAEEQEESILGSIVASPLKAALVGAFGGAMVILLLGLIIKQMGGSHVAVAAPYEGIPEALKAYMPRK